MDKVALVSGGSRGIGRALCVELAADGYLVGINYHTNQEAAEETLRLVKGVGGDGEILGFDVSDAEQAGLAVDDLGNLWVREYDPDAERGRSWSVFDSESQMLGPVQLPADLRVTHIGADFVLGVWQDELDVEYVRLYQLIKN